MGQILATLSDPDSWTGMDIVGDGISNVARFGIEEYSIRKALQNEIILHNIFSFIPTSLLLSSCSLVSKTWNQETREFIRDHRKCTVKNSQLTTACEFLQEFDRVCQQITEDGRLVPFNSLDIDFGKPCCNSSVRSEDIFYRNIIAGLKLKYLAIRNEWIDRPDCRYHKPLLTLLTFKGNKLQSLNIDSIHPFFHIFNYTVSSYSEWSPEFNQLEQLDIARMGLWRQKPCKSDQKSTLRWMLKRAPNLERITAGKLRNLSIVPKEILARVKLQGELEIQLHNRQDFYLLRRVSHLDSKLKELCLHGPSSVFQDEEDGLDLRREFDLAVNRMLQASHQSLQKIEIIGVYRFPGFANLSLPNVSKCIITKKPNEGTVEDLWNTFASIDFDRVMPRVNQVELYSYPHRPMTPGWLSVSSQNQNRQSTRIIVTGPRISSNNWVRTILRAER